VNIKLFILLILVLSVGAFWILPATGFGRRMKMNERLFYTINIIGVVCGGAGLAASMIMKQKILNGHYFEIILLPAVIIYLYSAVVMKAGDSGDPYDEKQSFNMTQAAALSLPFSMGGMFLLYAFFREGVFEGLVWFPLYVFLTLTVYSAGTLIYFRRS